MTCIVLIILTWSRGKLVMNCILCDLFYIITTDTSFRSKCNNIIIANEQFFKKCSKYNWIYLRLYVARGFIACLLWWKSKSFLLLLLLSFRKSGSWEPVIGGGNGKTIIKCTVARCEIIINTVFRCVYLSPSITFLSTIIFEIWFRLIITYRWQ